MKQIINVTDIASAKIKLLVDDKDIKALRISVRAKGCAGLSYCVEYVEVVFPDDIKVDFGDFAIFIDNKAIVYLAGITVDFVEEDLESGFVFLNPNAVSSCGCGTSFSANKNA